jgi:hypothetical protein
VGKGGGYAGLFSGGEKFPGIMASDRFGFPLAGVFGEYLDSVASDLATTVKGVF